MVEVRIGKKVLATDKQDLWNQLCTYAKDHVRSEKKAGWAWYKYQELTKEKPPRSWSFESAPIVPISSATAGKLRSMRIAHHKRATA